MMPLEWWRGDYLAAEAVANVLHNVAHVRHLAGVRRVLEDPFRVAIPVNVEAD